MIYDHKKERFRDARPTDLKTRMKGTEVPRLNVGDSYTFKGIPVMVHKITNKDIVLRRIRRKDLEKGVKQAKKKALPRRARR